MRELMLEAHESLAQIASDDQATVNLLNSIVDVLDDIGIWYSIAEAAAQLGTTPARVQRFIADGDLVAEQDGRVRRIHFGELERYKRIWANVRAREQLTIPGTDGAGSTGGGDR